jgi:PAS domain S-box-containing protein
LLTTRSKRTKGLRTAADDRLQAVLRANSESLIVSAQRLYSILDPAEVFQALAEEACSLSGAVLAVTLWEEDASFKIKGAVSSTGGRLVGAVEAERQIEILQAAAERAVQSSTAVEGAPGVLAASLHTGTGTGAIMIVQHALNIERWPEEKRSALSALASVGAVAISNANVQAESLRKATELQQLVSICSELASSADLERFLEKFVLRAATFLEFGRSFIALVEDGVLEVRYAADSNIGRHMRINIGSSLTRRLLDTRKPFFTEDASRDADCDQEFARMFSMTQYLAVPIFVAESPVFGVLGLLDQADGRPIGPEDVRRAEALAAQVAVALQSVQMLHASKKNQERAENLVGLALEMGSSLSIPELVRSLATRAGRLLNAKASAVGLCREASRGALIETVVLNDARVTDIREAQRQLGEFFSTYAAIRTDSLFTGRADSIVDREALRAVNWNDVLVTRLTGAGGELLGLFCLADYGGKLSQENLQLLQALVGHASIALENSRLFTRIAQSNKQWAELFDSISDYLVVHDDEYRIVRVNRPFSEFIGIRPSELIGRFTRELLPASGTSRSDWCPFCEGDGARDEFVSPGSGRVYLLSSSRVRGAANEALQTIHVLRDVTERREAERRYRELFDNVQEGVFFATPAGRFIDVNDALVRMLGYASREEMLGIDIPTQFYASDEMREAARQVRSIGSASNKEVLLRRKNGSIIYGLENSIAVHDAAGKVIQYRGLILDITETKNFQAQLQRQRDFNTQILNNTQSLIMVVDTAGLVSYANQRCYEAGGFTEDVLVGHRILDIVADPDRAPWIAAFDKVLHGRPVSNLEVQLIRGNHELGRFSVNISPMRGDQENVNSVVIVMTDVTDMAAIQAKLMHTEKMAAVGQLVSGVAHEVNNPLTAIMGFADLMLENPELPTTVHQDLHVIMQEAQRTKEIVQNLLSFSRQMPKQRHAVDLNAVLRRTVALRSYDFSSHGVTVIEHLGEGLPEVLGDAHQLQQVFLNILNNAYDAVCESERRGQIELRTRCTSNIAEVLFTDNGPGIRNPERIFDPFFTTKEVGKGTGLGLSICYGIVRQHGGEILCHNNAAAPGATFVIKLPGIQTRPLELARSAGGTQE